MHPDILSARIAAVNNANRYANELYPLLRAALLPFEGQEVIKTTGELLEKVKAALPTFPNTNKLSVYRGSSSHSLYWVVKTCESIASYGCTYHEQSVYGGSLNGQTLMPGELSSWVNMRTDWTAEEIKTLRADYEKAKKTADQALSALNPFGTYDRR